LLRNKEPVADYAEEGTEAMTRTRTALLTSEFSAALSLSAKFNIRAGARPSRQVKAVLSQAIDFLEPVANNIGRKGAVIKVGSAWNDPDVFLDAKKGLEMSRRKERIDYLTGTVDVALSKKDYARLSAIRKAFRLRSDKQAAALSLRVYRSVVEHLWRGNGFIITDKAGKPMVFDVKKAEAVVRAKPVRP
jgi:hypothetical protein